MRMRMMSMTMNSCRMRRNYIASAALYCVIGCNLSFPLFFSHALSVLVDVRRHSIHLVRTHTQTQTLWRSREYTMYALHTASVATN